MKWMIRLLALGLMSVGAAAASTIMVVPVFEPLSLRSTDGDDAFAEVGEALQATVISRPMALTGAFPEDLLAAIRTPHQIPTNNPNYQVKEANLMILCDVGISGVMGEDGLLVKIDVSRMVIPGDIDLTPRQLVKLVMIAARKTLESHHSVQIGGLRVAFAIEGADGPKAALKELEAKFLIEGADMSR